MSYVQQLKMIFLGSLFVLTFLLQTAIQIHLSFTSKDAIPSVEVPAEYSLPQADPFVEENNKNRIRLKKRSVPKKDLANLEIDSNTVSKPLMTSTPYPTLTQQASLPSHVTTATPSMSHREDTSSLSKSNPPNPKNYPHITDWSDVPDHFTLSKHYIGNFSFANPDLCIRKKNLTLLILVTTAIDHFHQRNSVRLTWGHYGLREDVQFAFVIGDALLHKYNESVKAALWNEVDLYQDFIIGDFADTYRNLTLKSLHMLDWVSSYCEKAQYFLKTDDDVFLNVPEILGFINKIKSEDELLPKIYGHVFNGHLPKRDASHRHHLKYDVYPHNIAYPNFTSGPAYLMSVGIVRPLFNEALKLPFINLEDVLINGFAAMNLNIPRVDVPEFINEIKNPADLPACELITILAGMTDGSAVQMNYVWYNYLMGRTICIWKRGSVG